MAAHDVVQPTFVVRGLSCLIRWWAPLLVKYDVAILVATLVFTAVCSIKIPFTKQEDDIRTGWSPNGARSMLELTEYTKYLGSQPTDPIATTVFVQAKDGGSMTRINHLLETINLLDELSSRVAWKNQSFDNFCGSMCAINEPLRMFYNSVVMSQTANFSDSAIADSHGLAFPIMSILGKEIDLSPHLSGVFLNAKKKLDFAKIVQFNFQTARPDNWSKSDVMEYERQLYRYVHKTYSSELIRPLCLSLTFATDEIGKFQIVRTGEAIFPFIGVGFVIMATFAVLTVWYQWSLHRANLAVLGCVCPLLATSTALGLLFWCGFRFGTILAVTPFLVLAIGVDDAFLQLQSWAKLREENPDLPLQDRMRMMLEDVGPSISITSITNFAAFLVGYFTPTPEIQLFCIGNAFAIIFDYVYQLTMYSCMISIGARFEEKRARPAALPTREIMRKMHRKVWLVFEVRQKPLQEESSQFVVSYSKWLASPYTTFAISCALVAYWYTVGNGALNMKALLSSKSLVIAGSEFVEIENIRETYVLPNYTTVIILVNKVGDLSSPDKQRQIVDLIEAFESYPEAIGPETTHFWFRDWQAFQDLDSEDFDESQNSTQFFTKTSMRAFLEWPEFRHWGGFMQFDANDKLDRFMATVSFHGDDLGQFEPRKNILKRWRSTIDEFADLEASIFDTFATFVDQTDTMVPATVSSSLTTLATMLLVCFFFMNSMLTIVIAALSIISICIGVFGFLALWNINLDPISMSCLIMSIGFSVDFPAHITFHFHRESLEHPRSTPAERVARCLEAIGFPLLQCGVSTVLFVLCLICIRTYMGEVFVKTVFLVVSLGLLHGLVIVPSFLCSLSNAHALICRGRKVSQATTKTLKTTSSDLPSSSSSSLSASSIEEGQRTASPTVR